MRKKWIDVAKLLAIIAVMIDHTNGLLYSNEYVASFSYFSVSLFIIVMGITTMWSYKKNNRDAIRRKVLIKLGGIVRPYIVATIIYGIVIYRAFDFEVLIGHLIRFSISGPFYYVLLYIQLVLVSPILFFVFEYTTDVRKGLLVEAAGFVAVLVISSWTTNYSNVMGVYGGGGKLFGGTYLILLYIGMWFGKYYDKIHFNVVVSAILAVFMSCATIAWWLFIAGDKNHIDTYVPYGGGFNPPSISFGVYAIFVALSLFFIEMILLHFPNSTPYKIMSTVSGWGKHTLYVFLYHCLFLDVLFPKLSAKTGIVIDNMWIKRIVYFVVMIAGSLLFEIVLERIHKRVRAIYR